MTYQELKKEYATRLNKVMESNGVFWAFGEKQMQEAIEKYGISKDNKIVSIGMGGYVPSKNFGAFNKSMQELSKWEKEEKKKIKEDKKQLVTAILYEINNHECYYTGELDDVYNIFPDVPRQEILQVYRSNREGIN